MEQIEYQSYNNPQGFKPVTQPDIVPALKAEARRQAEARQAYLAGLQRNQAVEVQNARQFGEGLKDLGQGLKDLSRFSATLQKKEVERIDEENQKALAAGQQQTFEAYMRGELDLTNFEASMNKLREANRTAQDVAEGVLNGNAENYEASSYLSTSSAWMEAGRRQQFAQFAVSNYPTYMDQAEQGRTFSSSAERAAFLAEARTKFFQDSGLNSLSGEFLASSGVFDKIARADAVSSRTWTQRFGVEQSQNQQAVLKSSFLSDFDLTSYQAGLRNTLGPDGKPLGNKGAWDQVVQTLTEARQGGLLSEADLINIEGQIIPQGAPGAGKRYGDFYKARFGQIRREVDKQIRDDWTNRQKDKQIAAKKWEEQMIDSFLNEDGDGFTDKQLEDAQLRYMQLSGGERSTKLDNISKLTVDDKTRREQKEKIEFLISQGALTMEELSKMDPAHQRTYRSIAQQQTKALNAVDSFEKEDTAIKDAIAMATNNFSTITRGHWTVGLKEAQLKQQFRSEFARLAQTMPAEEAASVALQNTIQAFSESQQEGKPGKFVSGQGFPDMVMGAGERAGMEDVAKQRISMLNSAMQQYGNEALDMADTLFSQQELKDMSKGMGKPGFKMDPRLSYVAEQYGLSPFQVLNRQLEANGMDLPPPSPAMEVIENQLTPEQQRLLNVNPSQFRVERGLTGIQAFAPELLPARAQPYAQLIQQSAQKHGIDPAIMTGMLETESGWLPEVIKGTRLSSAGAAGIAQFMPPTAAQYGVNPLDPASAIDGMARYMKDLLAMFNGDYRLAVTAYNAGQGNVMKYGGPIPGNAESEGYWPKVLRAAGKYGYGKQAIREPALMRPSSPVAKALSHEAIAALPTIPGPDGKPVPDLREYYE